MIDGRGGRHRTTEAGNVKKVWRLTTMLAVMFACLGVAAAGASGANKQQGRGSKSAGQLDPGFGRQGTFAVATPPVVSENGTVLVGTTHLAIAPSNKSYAQQGQLVVGFGANGKPDPKFGNHGRMWVEPGPGKVIEMSGVAVDSQGRVLVAGTYEPFPGFTNPIATGEAERLYFGDEGATEAFVIRYLPNGQPDPTFGNAGVAITSLNVPRPTNEPVAGKGPTGEYERPVVTVSGIRVDSQDRPVISGQYVYVQRACFYRQHFKHAIVARLTVSGSVDPSFGGGGLTTFPGEHALAVAGGPGGEWVALGEGEHACYRDLPPHPSKLTVLSEAGAPSALDPGAPDLIASGALAVDGQGRILFAEQEGENGLGQPKITRLLPSGDVDTSFGHDGGIVLSRFAPDWPVTLAVDANERIVVGLGGSHQLEVTRLTPSGKIEGKFGHHGLARVPKGEASLQAVAIDSKGRILAAGTAIGGELKTGQGIGIARFLPGS
jgi:uncharacterized delta-60 repeat protein